MLYKRYIRDLKNVKTGFVQNSNIPNVLEFENKILIYKEVLEGP